MKRILFIAISATLLASAATADEIDPLIGTWITRDGQVKQRIERSFDGSWLETAMWFRTETGWRQVSAGVAYQRPGEDNWRGVGRTRGMNGTEFFRNTLRFVSEGRYYLANVAYQSDATKIITEQEWEFEDDDRYSYTIYSLDTGERVELAKDRWVRAKTAD